MKKQNVLRLLSLLFLTLAMGQPVHAGSNFWRWLQSLYNQGRTGDMFYSQLTANAIGDGKVYVHWPTEADANHETTADEIEVNGAEVYTETSPDDATARAGVHGWGESEDYSDHTYLVYAEPHTGFEVDGLYTNEACTTAYDVTSANTFTGEGFMAYRITIRSTERTNRANATSLNLYARFVLNVTIGSRGYSTLYYSKYNFTVPSGVTATTYKLNENNKLTVSRTYSVGDVIPAGEPVVLEASAGTYKFVPVKSTSNTPDTENILKGSDEAVMTTGGDEYFALLWSEAKGAVGFYYKNPGGAAFVNGAHKAYIALRAGSDVKGFDLTGEDDATGISNVDANVNANGPIFNLAGQRVGKMQKGINIVNGKKILK